MLRDTGAKNILFLSTIIAITLPLLSTCAANPASLASNKRYSERATTNLSSATANQDSGHQDLSSITPLPPRSLFWNDFVPSRNLIFTQWAAFPPFPPTVKALSVLYSSIQHTLAQNRSDIARATALSFTYGALRLTCRCLIDQAAAAVAVVLWDEILGGFIKGMRDFARAGLTGLYTVSFYFCKGAVVWSVVVALLILAPNARDGVAQNLIP